ncbi:hypothetical protein GCM10011507_14890 [Edaphobacter acidisoli]|uniref:Uncharacterized protein n=1 Tax=Edaphobacter acidisoli TaxID=2040573 RepID=A0A916RPT7_9BACT|nr:hypothetical protein [Edaphobacter acidisoli]GGA64322.1 hypothetical protein GCM10011507_14890 [Edaphobacter acidisoli]
MTKKLQLAAIALLLTGATLAARAELFHHKDKPPKSNVQWMWQYGPPPTGGRENALVLDPRFRPFLAETFKAPQTFWGNAKTGYKPLAETALDFVSIPDKVVTDGNRYLTITGCVFRFCPDRGMIWLDLGQPQPLAVFAAINWIQQNKTPDEPDAEYTLWVFPNQPLDAEHIPPALANSIAHWTAEPPSGSTVIQKIRNAILVAPDGTPHPIAPATLGANTITLPDTQLHPDTHSLTEQQNP